MRHAQKKSFANEQWVSLKTKNYCLYTRRLIIPYCKNSILIINAVYKPDAPSLGILIQEFYRESNAEIKLIEEIFKVNLVKENFCFFLMIRARLVVVGKRKRRGFG